MAIISESIGVARREGATDTQLLRLIFVTVNSWSRCHLVTMTIIIIISCCAGPTGECIPSYHNNNSNYPQRAQNDEQDHIITTMYRMVHKSLRTLYE